MKLVGGELTLVLVDLHCTHKPTLIVPQLILLPADTHKQFQQAASIVNHTGEEIRTLTLGNIMSFCQELDEKISSIFMCVHLNIRLQTVSLA